MFLQEKIIYFPVAFNNVIPNGYITALQKLHKVFKTVQISFLFFQFNIEKIKNLKDPPQKLNTKKKIKKIFFKFLKINFLYFQKNLGSLSFLFFQFNIEGIKKLK